jgi:hypothetical protein
VKLVREVKGAVYVELLIAYLPVLFFFLATWQLIEMAAANLIVKRAASAAARAAVVVLPDNPRYYGGAGVNSPTGLKKVDIDQAARLVLLASPHLGSDFRVELSGEMSGHGQLTATVTARFHCTAGWVSLVCGGRSRELVGRATHVYQGADFDYENL